MASRSLGRGSTGRVLGSGPGVNPFESAIHAVQSDGTMIANWYMPYRKSVQIGLQNCTASTVKYIGTLNLSDAEPAADSLYFHARWRHQDGLQTKKAEGTLDWTALRVSGASGRFVGLLLDIFNPTPAWWGEGDEKIYVDGESFPSTFGTGTEDFFGYAWGDNHTYMNPFHAQTRCDGPGAKGNSSNIRYQVLDSVPFHKSLGFDIEVWHWEAVQIQYATAAFFYAGPGQDRAWNPRCYQVGRFIPSRHSNGNQAPSKRKTSRSRPAPPVICPVKICCPSAMPGRQGGSSGGLCTSPGHKIDLELPVKSAGTYAISAAFTKAGDYGIVQLAVVVDGKPLGKPIDLYEPAPGVVHAGDVTLGTATFDAGPHLMSVVLTGKNARSTNFLVGMDWIKLTPVAGGSAAGPK